jgi:hypothetical protein
MGLIHKELVSTKADYVNDYARGTVSYSPKCRNYSFHKVEIPDGTKVIGCNFKQRVPFTEAITGKNLVFEKCNLVNILIDPTWQTTGCNISQVKTVITKIENKEGDLSDITISRQVYDEKSSSYKTTETIEDTLKTSDVANKVLSVSEDASKEVI